MEASSSPFYVSLRGDYSTPAGYAMFFTGIVILGGLAFYIIRYWLKPLLSHASGSGGISSAKKAAIMLSIVMVLLTLGYIFMPMISIISEEVHMEVMDDSFDMKFRYTDGGVHDAVNLMEERNDLDTNWRDVRNDLSMMQWTLFSGLMLSVVALMGLAITLAAPRYVLGLLMQNAIFLVFAAFIVFLIGQIMLWSDIPGLSMEVSGYMNMSRDYSYGNNYLPFLSYLLAVPAAVMGCVYLTPYSFQLFRNKQYAGRGAYSGTGTYGEEIPMISPGGSEFPAFLRKHRTPLIAGSGILTLLVAGILVFALVDFGGEGKTPRADNVVKFDADNFDLVEASPEILQDYAAEGEEYTYVYRIDDTNVASVSFLLTWTDEEDSGWIGASPNHRNEPDTFTIMVENPTGEFMGSASGSNSHGQEGIVEFMVPVPMESVPSLNGTGGWNITLTVVAGDNEPIGPGIFKFLDNGNDFTLQISHEYYLPRESTN